LIYVDGDVTVNCDQVSGLTLVATGAITLNGSVVLKKGDTVNSAFIAGGNILLNNFSELSSLFWSNHSIVPVGAGKLAGTMVCQGFISFGPGLQFERVDTISDIYFCSDLAKYAFAVKGWSQM
jgi:hypothetical protein